jgi:phosphoglycolate phosphatase-like HAD superfamily hydrolase
MNNKLALILDLDETLISTDYRQYACIKAFVLQTENSFISFNKYLKLRVEHNFTNTQLLQFLNINTDKGFANFYKKHIESVAFLQLDSLIINKKSLGILNQIETPIYLLSLRSKRNNSLQQLKYLNLNEFFKAKFFTKHNKLQNSKVALIEQLKQKYDKLIMIGDSKTDYEAAKQSKILFLGVDTGLFKLYLPKNIKLFKDINACLQTLKNEIY